MQFNRHSFAVFIRRLDFFGWRNKIYIHNMMIELPRVRVAFCRTHMVVKSHTRADDINQRKAIVHQCAFNQRHELFLVT